VGPQDVFRNPLAIYRLNQPCPDGESPFDLELGVTGDAFAINAMHFKLGLYEHQSAGAIQSLVDLFGARPALAADLEAIRRIGVRIYEPAYSIIADPAIGRPLASLHPREDAPEGPGGCEPRRFHRLGVADAPARRLFRRGDR
jgi:2-methylcitrate dehydratase